MALIYSLAKKLGGYDVSGGRNKPLRLTVGQLSPPNIFASGVLLVPGSLSTAEKLVVSLSHQLVHQQKILGRPIITSINSSHLR